MQAELRSNSSQCCKADLTARLRTETASMVCMLKLLSDQNLNSGSQHRPGLTGSTEGMHDKGRAQGHNAAVDGTGVYINIR